MTGPPPAHRPVRVLQVVKGLGPGGAERLLVAQAGARDRDRFHYEAVYLVPWKDHLVPELEAAGVAVACLGDHRRGDPRWVLRLRRHLRGEPVDVVHVHSPAVAAVTRLLVRTLPRRRRPAVVTTEHNRWPRHHPVTRAANRATLGLDDRTLSVSEDVRATIEPARRRATVEVVVHGVDLDAVREAADRAGVRAELGVGPDEVVIGTVANHRREKAYDVLLAAAAIAIGRADEEGLALRVVAVGQGPLEDEARAHLARLDLGDRVQLLGYRADAVRVTSGFDVFTLASRHEGLPVALMDALTLGLPVVATAVGGVPEAVHDGVEGRLVPADDPDALAAAWLELAGDPERRAAMAAAAARAGTRFDIRRTTAVLEDHYLAVARPR